MADLLLWAEAAIAFLAFAGVYLILRGFIPIFLHWRNRDAVWHLAGGIILTVGPLSLRLLYWTLAPLLIPDDIRQVIGKAPPNVITGAIVIVGIYLLLKLQWLIIPEIDRPRYSILSAAWYPHDTEWRLGIVMNLLRKRKDQ